MPDELLGSPTPSHITILSGDIPLWQPYVFAGTPFWAAGQHSVLYPFSIFFWVMPLTKAYGWYTLSQLWLAGVLMYVYGRILRMRRSSAFVASAKTGANGCSLGRSVSANAGMPLIRPLMMTAKTERRRNLRNDKAKTPELGGDTPSLNCRTKRYSCPAAAVEGTL